MVTRLLACLLALLCLFGVALASDWTIGPAGDYETLALALYDTTNVTRGDTLTLLPGTHMGPGSPPGWGRGIKHRMTIRGATGDRDDVTIRPQTSVAPAIIADMHDVVIRDITFRSCWADTGRIPLTGGADIIDASDPTATFSVINCAFRAVLANTSGLGSCISDETASAASTAGLVIEGCLFDSIQNIYGTTGRGPISIEDVLDTRIRNCTFSNCSSGRGPLYWAAADITSPTDLHITGCSFADNVATSATFGPGALLINYFTVAADHDSTRVSHCTFYNNNPATAARGQVQFKNAEDTDAVTEATMDHCIFYGNGVDYAMSAPSYTQKIASATYCDSYNNVENHLWATTQGDTLQLDPVFVTTDPESARAFMPQSCVEVDGSSCRITDETPASYIGWIAPVLNTAPVQTAPPDGSPNALTTVTLDWNAVAQADSYAVKYGPTCGTGTYHALAAAATSYDATVTASTIYCWRVRTLDCDGWGSWSNCWVFGDQGAGSNRHRRGH